MEFTMVPKSLYSSILYTSTSRNLLVASTVKSPLLGLGKLLNKAVSGRFEVKKPPQNVGYTVIPVNPLELHPLLILTLTVPPSGVLYWGVIGWG